MIRCSEVRLLLSDYADGETDERGRRIVERHVQLCQSCRSDVLALRMVGLHIERLSLLPVGISARLPRFQRALESQLVARQRARQRVPWILLALVGLVLVEAATVWLYTVLSQIG
ncbi:MAG: hypothetical protein NVS4B8_02270 [Herpetosiphon sp.]